MKLAENKPMIEQAKAEAREKGEIVTRQAVLEKAKSADRERREQKRADSHAGSFRRWQFGV